MLWPRGGRSPQQAEAGGHSRRRLAGRDKGWPGDQARPRGLKPRAAAAAAARRVPSHWQRSSHAAGDHLLSGAGDQAGGCSGLQRGEPRGGTGWYLHLAPVLASCSVYPVSRSTGAPGLGVLRHSPSTGCVVRLRVPYMCPALCSAQIMAPAKSILPALMPLAGCAL